MPKAEQGYDLERYAPVARRITLFYERYPAGRIITALVQRDARSVVFCARVYRTAEDAKPAATGWALEREGDGDVNVVACLENTETSAIGRALANLGFTASRARPSAEEMAKASRARVRLGLALTNVPDQSAVRSIAPARLRPPNAEQRGPVVADLFAQLIRAERLGVRPARATRWRRVLLEQDLAPDLLVRCERRLRLWIQARVVSPVGTI